MEPLTRRIAPAILLLLLVSAAAAFAPGDPVPPGFAPPWDVFGGDAPFFSVGDGTLPLETTDDTTALFTVTLGQEGRYFYNTLYSTIDGSPWQAFLLNASLPGDAWLPVSARLALQVPSDARAAYIVSYSCKQEDGEWKCGCSSADACGQWAIQDIPLMDGPRADDCRLPGNACGAERPFCNVATGTCDECMRSDTTLCGDHEACVEGSCALVQCLSNADCVGVAADGAAGLRRSVCDVKANRCVACNTNADCIYKKDGAIDITGTCDFGTHFCSYLSESEGFCRDECMPELSDGLGYGGTGKCEGKDLYHCSRRSSGCLKYTRVRTCAGNCEMAGFVSYCAGSPPPCGRPCGADNACNPYCARADIDPFCADNVDPDCA